MPTGNPLVGETWGTPQDGNGAGTNAVICAVNSVHVSLMARTSRVVLIPIRSLELTWTFQHPAPTQNCYGSPIDHGAYLQFQDRAGVWRWTCEGHLPPQVRPHLPFDQPQDRDLSTLLACPNCGTQIISHSQSNSTCENGLITQRCGGCNHIWVHLIARGLADDGMVISEQVISAADALQGTILSVRAIVGGPLLRSIERAVGRSSWRNGAHVGGVVIEEDTQRRIGDMAAVVIGQAVTPLADTALGALLDSREGRPSLIPQLVNTASAAASLQEITEVHRASFEGQVHVDLASPYSGTGYPTGTPQRPVNNYIDAQAIADANGFPIPFAQGLPIPTTWTIRGVQGVDPIGPLARVPIRGFGSQGATVAGSGVLVNMDDWPMTRPLDPMPQDDRPRPRPGDTWFHKETGHPVFVKSVDQRHVVLGDSIVASLEEFLDNCIYKPANFPFKVGDELVRIDGQYPSEIYTVTKLNEDVHRISLSSFAQREELSLAQVLTLYRVLYRRTVNERLVAGDNDPFKDLTED